MHILIGISSAGKTLFAEKMLENKSIVNFHEIKPWTNIKNKVVHINILKLNQLNFKEKIILKKIFSNLNQSSTCNVVASEKNEILKRIRNRKIEDSNHVTKYDKDYWFSQVSNTNLPKLYERAILFFDIKNPNLSIWWNDHKGFTRVKRYSLKYLFDGASIDSHIYHEPNKELLNQIKYQDLNFGENTSRIGRKRNESIMSCLHSIEYGDSALDVGSAMGATIFSIDSVTNGKVTGFEPMRDRYNASKNFCSYLSSDVRIINDYVNDETLDETYDHIVCLNVMHHVQDFVSFLKKLCNSANKSLIIELPDIQDKVFSDNLGKYYFFSNRKIPLIGVGNKESDQTFVYNPSAIIRLIKMLSKKKFLYHLYDSPLDSRYIIKIDFTLNSTTGHDPLLDLVRNKKIKIKNFKLLRFIYFKIQPYLRKSK